MLTRLEDENYNRKAAEKLEQLYYLYAGRLLNYAVKTLNNQSEAEEIVHSAYIKVMEILDKVDEPEAGRTYNLLFTIVKNKCIDYLRRTRRECLISFEDEMPDLVDERTPESIFLEKESYFSILEVIQQMPENYGAVLLLHYVHELEISDIAKVLGISKNLVSVRMNRGRKWIMSYIRNEIEKDAVKFGFNIIG